MLKRRLLSLADRVASRVIDPRLDARTDAVRFAVGVQTSGAARAAPLPARLRDAEFSVFSQWGEDGVIQHLVDRLDPPDTFVEIGVGDYTESNTRFLLMKDNWRGLIVNGGTEHQEMLRRTGLAWRHSIDAVSAFVTAENVDELIAAAGISGEIGLLSIDVDGIDYWLWDAVSVVSPWIVIVEHNSAFGPDLPVTVPYDPGFVAATAHPSHQYFGASLAALHRLGRSRGYRLVGVGSSGVNAFFVRDDVAGDVWDLSPEEAYVRSRYRTARAFDGSLAFTGSDHAALLASMRDLPLLDVSTGAMAAIADLYPNRDSLGG